jgi:beta-carotene hydroxylase
MLKYRADLRTLAYMTIITTLFVVQWMYGFHWFTYFIYLVFSISVSVMTHNHVHLNMWKNRALNVLTDWWLTVFYGVPIFTWIPTHNRNHHRHNNKVGDSSLTYRHTEENDLASLLSYPSVSGYYQMKESIVPYMSKLRREDRTTFLLNWLQVVVLFAWIIAFLVFDWKRAILYVLIPQQVSAFVVMLLNYVQHVHADEESEYNHSRNFMGANLFLFNNGYHTAHHMRAGVHWSEIPAEHAKIAHLIDPSLIEPSLVGFFWRVYVMGTISKKFKTFNMRKARMTTETVNTNVAVEA